MTYILSQTQNHICTITLNRPEKYNSFVREMALSLQQVLDEANNNSNVKVIVITANGKAFCAGQDLQEAIDPSLGIKKIVDEHYNPIILKIKQIRKPIIAIINGVAAGAGANIALACDIVLAKKSASFIQAFSKIGLIPDSGGTYTLPRLVGLQNATALMLSGDALTADEAKNLGMVYKVLSDENYIQEGMELATKIAQMPLQGLQYTKTLLIQTYQNNLETQLQLESQYQEKAANTDEHKACVVNFLNKKK